MPSVMVTGYKRSLNVIAFVKLIQRLTGETLAPAKNQVDSLLEGQPFELTFTNEAVADEFCHAAGEIGAVVNKGAATGSSG